MKEESETIYNKLNKHQYHIIKIEKEIQSIRTENVKQNGDQIDSIP